MFRAEDSSKSKELTATPIMDMQVGGGPVGATPRSKHPPDHHPASCLSFSQHRLTTGSPTRPPTASVIPQQPCHPDTSKATSSDRCRSAPLSQLTARTGLRLPAARVELVPPLATRAALLHPAARVEVGPLPAAPAGRRPPAARVVFFAQMNCPDTYIVMEYIRGKTAGQCLAAAQNDAGYDAAEERAGAAVSLAMTELLRIPIEPGTRPAAISGTKIRHPGVFDTGEAPRHYEDVQQLEAHFNAVSHRFCLPTC